MNKTILSGTRAISRLHFGHYLGAIQNFVNFQQPGYECFYFVADWHTLTDMKDTQALQTNLKEVVKDYVAAGVDPEKSTIYVQSSVPEIAELSLYLSMVQPLGDLQRVPTIKDNVRKHADSINLSTLSYPVLMSADILGSRADIVPVGQDQMPNVEMARELARRFNKRFREVFVIPELLDSDDMVRIPGLDGQKMGASGAHNEIDIHSDMKTISERYLRRGITDARRKMSGDPGNPDDCKSVYPVHKVVTHKEKETGDIAKLCKAGTISCTDCKNLLVESLAKVLGPFQERRADLAPKDTHISEMLHEGGKRARKVIAETTKDARDAVGITRY